MRENKMTVIVGENDTGKSTFANRVAEAYYKIHNQRILIIDPNRAVPYQHHQSINAHNFYPGKQRWARGIKKYWDRDIDEMFNVLDETMYNSLIIFDDAVKYIGPTPSKKVKGVLVDFTNRNNDLIFTFHALKFIPSWFWMILHRVEIFKTQDNFEDKGYWTSRNVEISKIEPIHKKVMDSKNFHIVKSYIHK